MAETTTVAQIDTTENISPAVKNSKNPPGRPRKDGLPAGSVKEIDTEEDIQEFFAKLKPLSDDWWNAHVLYLYRQYPITDRRAAGKLLWIDKFCEPVDQERIMHLHGSGTYRLDLIEDSKRIASTGFRILNMDYPPIVPPGDWVDDPKNKDWEWCRPKLAQQNGTNGQSGISPKELMDTMLRFKEATDQPQPQDTASDLITRILESPVIAKLIPENKPPAPPAEDKSLTMLMNMMLEDRKAMREEMKELRAQLASKPTEKSPIEWLLEHEDLGRRIFGRGGANGPGSEGKTWVDIAEKTIEKLGPALVPLAQAGATMMIRGSSPQQPQAPGRPPITVQPAPANLPAAQPTQAAPQQQAEAPAAPGPTQENPENMNALSFAQKYGQVIQAASPFLLDLYLNGGEFGGYEFRDWFMNRYGNQLWNALRNEAGVDGMLQVAKFNPEYWKQLEPEEKFKAFMTDFFTAIGKERAGYDDEDDDFETPPEGADNAA